MALGTAKAEAVRQLAAQGFPKDNLLLLGELEQLIVVFLEVRVFFDDFGAVAVVAGVSTFLLLGTITAAAAAASSATTSSSTALFRELASINAGTGASL